MLDIEKRFFETFGIEQIRRTYCTHGENCVRCDSNCKDLKIVSYPSITDRLLLELICILNKHYYENYQCATMLIGLTLCEVKRCILTECLENEKHIRQQVRALFSEASNV